MAKPSPQQFELRSGAIISLGYMCLAALLFHILLMPTTRGAVFRRSEDRVEAFESSWFYLLLLYLAWLAAWGANVAESSVYKRGQSFSFGLIAASISLAYVLLTEPRAPAQVYMSSTLWATHVGLVLGALLKCLPKPHFADIVSDLIRDDAQQDLAPGFDSI